MLHTVLEDLKYFELEDYRKYSKNENGMIYEKDKTGYQKQSILKAWRKKERNLTQM